MLGIPPAKETTSGRFATANRARTGEVFNPRERVEYRSWNLSKVVSTRRSVAASAASGAATAALTRTLLVGGTGCLVMWFVLLTLPLCPTADPEI